MVEGLFPEGGPLARPSRLGRFYWETGNSLVTLPFLKGIFYPTDPSLMLGVCKLGPRLPLEGALGAGVKSLLLTLAACTFYW